jgi:glycosyltransferase involved in cell wall biosynthesis
VLVGTASTADLLATALGLPRGRLQVLGLGYRRRFADLPPLPAPSPAGPLRFAFWGGVAPHKGIGVLVEALRLLLAAPLPRPVELHVLGGFATAAYEREQRAAAAGLPVVFHGRFATAALHAVAPSVGVFPSTCLETFGIVLDECFELGRPAIVADRGALPERIGGGGLVVPAGDARALAAALRRFAVEPGLWSALRERLPPLPPEPAAHRAAVAAVYAAARVRRSAAGTPPDDGLAPARASLLRLQRESALARLPHDGLR